MLIRIMFFAPYLALDFHVFRERYVVDGEQYYGKIVVLNLEM